MKFPILVLIFFIFNINGYGQSYKQAKVYLENQLVIKVRNLELTGDVLTYLNKATNKNESNSLAALSLIKIAKGNYVFEGAAFGAGSLALAALLIDIDPDPLLDKKRGAGFYLTYTAVGTLIGALVGLLVPKWKSIYSGGKFIGFNQKLNFDINTQNEQFNIKISIGL